MRIDAIYNEFFPIDGLDYRPKDWSKFTNYSSQADLSITTNRTWQDTAKEIALIIMKIIIFPWGLYEGIKALVGRMAMVAAYPAQIMYSKKSLGNWRNQYKSGLNDSFVWKDITLEKNGNRYSGFLVGLKSNIENKKWAIFAPGNAATIEGCLLNYRASPYLKAGFNVLLVNGPGVGNSTGWATAEKIGEAQQLGLLFLESAVKAEKIVLSGHSLGAAAIGKAVLNHQFKPDVNYLAIRMMTFSRLTDIVRKIAGSLASKIITWTGSEMDSIAASRKLQEKGIHEIVVEAGNDDMMDRVRLTDALNKENLTKNKTRVLISNADHNYIPEETITERIVKWNPSLNPAEAI